jgi:hypothetical protein
VTLHLLLRLWLAAAAVLLAALAAWAFAPILVFIGLVVAGLALLSVATIVLARLLRRLRERADRDGGPRHGA